MVGGCRLRRTINRPRPTHCCCKSCKELIRHFLGGAIDQALADLGQLAPDIGINFVRQDRIGSLGHQFYACTALGKTGRTACTFPGNAIAIGRVKLAQGDLALEGGRYRPDFGFDRRAQFGGRYLLDPFAAGNTTLKDCRIIQCSPNFILGGRNGNIT